MLIGTGDLDEMVGSSLHGELDRELDKITLVYLSS